MAQSQDPVTLNGFNTVQALRRARTTAPAHPQAEPARPPSVERAASAQPARIRHTIMPARHAIRCYHCGFEFVHTGRLEKVLCHKCRMFLNTDAQTIEGEWNGRMQTLGTVTVAAAGDIKSGEVVAMDLLLHGRVSGGRLDVMRRLELFPGSGLNLALFRYTDLVVHEGVTLVLPEPIKCGALTVAGELEGSAECSGCVTIAGTARFRGSIRAPSLVVEDGAAVEADMAVGSEAAQPATAA